MRLSSDQLIFWQSGFVKLNGTIVTTWALMILLTVVSRLVTRKLTSGITISRWQCFLEIIVSGIKKQIEEVGLTEPEKYIGFFGHIISLYRNANLCTIFPGYEPPTGSLSTTAALAICVFVAVPLFGIVEGGFISYLESYLSPSFIMLALQYYQ